MFAVCPFILAGAIIDQLFDPCTEPCGPSVAAPNMGSNKTLYLANPYGFSAQQREGPLSALVEILETLGAEVWEPFARNNQIDRTSPGWSYRIGQADLRDVRDADGLFAVVNGCPPDEGVMVELGMAIAWEKPVFLFRDDFRRCADSEAYPLNLMVFTGLPEAGWEAYWYGSVEEIADPGKALARWLRDEGALDDLSGPAAFRRSGFFSDIPS